MSKRLLSSPEDNSCSKRLNLNMDGVNAIRDFLRSQEAKDLFKQLFDESIAAINADLNELKAENAGLKLTVTNLEKKLMTWMKHWMRLINREEILQC